MNTRPVKTTRLKTRPKSRVGGGAAHVRGAEIECRAKTSCDYYRDLAAMVDRGYHYFFEKRNMRQILRRGRKSTETEAAAPTLRRTGAKMPTDQDCPLFYRKKLAA